VTEQKYNRLAQSSSPYLRSAAHQPVDWHPWGEEAFELAQAEDKPVLLDIGAVWCHWCHVMDRESYENGEIAALINRYFVPVKVDRDELPEVDSRYQLAVSAISGQGGWPLTAFLTPAGIPFYGGTYFPPQDAMGRPGFARILQTLAEAFRTRRAEVDRSSEAIVGAVSQLEESSSARGVLDAGFIDDLTEAIQAEFDPRNGGFGSAPKFLHASAVDFLLERYQATGVQSILDTACTTLEKMALGGIHDQLGGGFHRYSVDERWVVPHFEKMSSDNSQLLRNYVHGFQVTGKPLFRTTAESLIAWVFAVLSEPSERGGFYASQDADYSLVDDGDYFTWTLEEVRAALDPGEARAIELFYDVTPHGEMHHNPAKNVLWRARTAEEIAEQLEVSEGEARGTIARALAKLLGDRAQRPTPSVDKSLYVAWNAMFASAFLEAADVLERLDCRRFALRTIDRILEEAWSNKSGFAHRLGGPALSGGLDDQVLTCVALLDAYEATMDGRYFDAALRGMKLVVNEFGDPTGGFFDRAASAPPLTGLGVRRKPIQDSPGPSPNAVTAIVLDRLYSFTGDQTWRDLATCTLEAFAGVLPRLGIHGSTPGLAILLHTRGWIDTVITGAADSVPAAKLVQAGASVYRAGKSVLRVTPGMAETAHLPWALASTLPHFDAKVAQAFVCAGSACQAPVADGRALRKLLQAAGAAATPSA
jgi:uncharacterized protein